MKFLFAVVLSFRLFSLHSQELINCKILNAFLENDNAKGVFGFDTYKDVPIIIVDMKNHFNGCVTADHYRRKVEIVNDSSYQKITNHSNIIIYDLTKTGKRYKINVYFKVREAFGDIYFKKKKDYFIVSKFAVGNF